MASDQHIGLTASAHTGSLQREWRRCGKPTCRCTNGMLHGPYWYLQWRDRGVKTELPHTLSDPVARTAETMSDTIEARPHFPRDDTASAPPSRARGD